MALRTIEPVAPIWEVFGLVATLALPDCESGVALLQLERSLCFSDGPEFGRDGELMKRQGAPKLGGFL